MIRAIVLLSLLAASTGAARWSAEPIASAQFESHPAFDANGRTMLFVRSSPHFSGWRLFMSQCQSDGWGPPAPARFSGDGVEADPFFAADGFVYFISTRSEVGVRQRELDIWRVAYNDGAWGAPERLPEPINSPGNEWFPRPAADGWLYFGSDRAGGLGATDIYRARLVAGAWQGENLGAAINGAGDEYEAEISADGARMILMADGDLYESRFVNGAWTTRSPLSDVNTPAMEVGPLLSPDGASLLFARDSGDPALSGEIYVTGEAPGWPPDCGD